MKKYLSSIIDIRKGEVGITLLMLANIYLLLVAYYFLKPARDSLFLVKLGPEQLPLVFILTAFAIVPITTLYSRASRTVKLNNLMNMTLLLVIICLFVLRWLMRLPYFWVPYLFYTWVSIYGVLTTSQFWLLANAVYNATQAKRLFTLLGLGSILGAWTGGEVTNIVVRTFGVATEDLLFFCVGIMLLCMVITTAAWSIKKREIEGRSKVSGRKVESKESLGQMFGSIKRSRHLLLIVGIITLTMMVASLVDFQFKAVSTLHYQDPVSGEVDKSALTAFLGLFYGRLSLVSIFLQILFTYRFLRILGVGGVILFLPLGLLVGSVALLINISLVGAVLLRGADGSLKYSVDKTGRELLFLPVPLELKKRTKVFIDMFVDRWARGVAGGLLLLLIAWFNYEANPIEAVRTMSYVVVGFLVVWLIMALLMRREYVNTFRKAIEKREIDFSEIRININESATIATLANSLKSQNVREVEYALGMLREVSNVNLIEPLRPLLKHPSADIRKKTIHVLLAQQDKTLIPDVKLLLDDDDVEVRRDAMYFLFSNADGGRDHMIKVFLTHPEPRYRYAAVSSIAMHGAPDEKALIDDDTVESLINLPGEEGVVARRQVAGAMGYLGDARYNRYFKRFLNDSDSGVVNNAIWSVGQLKDRNFVPWLLNALADKRFRRQAREALAAYDVSILGTLFDYLTDGRVEPAIRRSIPRVMSQIPRQEAVDGLTSGLVRVDNYLKYYVVKALNRLRTGYPELKFDEASIDEALMEETRGYYEILQLIDIHCADDTDASKLMVKSLREKLDQNLERIFRILGLSYPPGDIYNAYLGIVSSRQDQRASAIEFLDNLLKSNVKRYLLPILDESSVDKIIRKGQDLFGIRFADKDEALLALIDGRDHWLKVCAIYCCRDQKSDRINKAVEAALHDREPIVRETAALVLNRRIT
ncbi:MAG: HEAT repeat domain-containing protein [Candidatus Zixiibacteriota bacterium]|nr:MAG: HEAT repeat domain-containing protein [candidate division Zixibacteria bacterium]